MKKIKLAVLTTAAVLAISGSAMAKTQGSYGGYRGNQGTYIISSEDNVFTYSSNGQIKQVILTCNGGSTGNTGNNNNDCNVDNNCNTNNDCDINNDCNINGGCDIIEDNCADGNCDVDTITPEIPNKPETPTKPEVPVVPETPTKPEVPSKPETPSANISAYAQEVVDLVNVERAKGGLAPLSIDMNAVAAAQVRAAEIKVSFSHTRPDGRTCYSALDEAGAKYSGAGENIAIGQKTPQQVVTAWMNSEGHRANIMNKNFKYIGVGVSGTAWTQFFTY